MVLLPACSNPGPANESYPRFQGYSKILDFPHSAGHVSPVISHPVAIGAVQGRNASIPGASAENDPATHQPCRLERTVPDWDCPGATGANHHVDSSGMTQALQAATLLLQFSNGINRISIRAHTMMSRLGVAASIEQGIVDAQ